jgi:hypothetical protein
MNTIKVPVMKEIMMQGLLNSITQNNQSNTETVIVTENGISSFKVQVKPEPIEATMLRKYLNGEYLNPIGPLTLLQTKVHEIRKKFLKSGMTYKDMVEYNKAAKDLGIQYNKNVVEDEDEDDEEHE